LHATLGLGAAVVECATLPNDANRTDIMNTLAKKVPQWTDGWDDDSTWTPISDPPAATPRRSRSVP
jgi:hypothetical protein